MTKKGQDTFFMKSLRYGANPDLSPRHVGMDWTIADSSDTVKFAKNQMED